MAKALTPAQEAEAKTLSTRYTKEQYRAAIDRVIESETSAAVDEDFPGVKPANVLFQMKRQLQDGDPITVGRHPTLGTVVMYESQDS